MLFFAGAAALFALTPPPGTPVVNIATVSYADANGNTLPPETATVQTPIAGAPVLVVAKNASSNPVSTGSIVTYTIAVANTGNISASGIVVTDDLSKHLEFQSASSDGVYTPGPPEGGKVEWNIDSLLPGQSRTFTVAARVKTADDYPPGSPDTIENGTVIPNTATAVSTEASGSTSIGTTVEQAPNTGICQSVSSVLSEPGGILTYNINYTNTGNATATGVFIINEIPGLTSLVAGTITGGGTVSGNSITWYIGDLEPGAEGFLQFSVKISPVAAEGSIITNLPSIGSAQQATLACAPASTLVTSAEASLNITKAGLPVTVIAGTDIAYTIDVENDGAHPLTGVSVKDAIPGGTEFISADGSGIFTGSEVIWNAGTLEPGETKSFSLLVRVDPGTPDGANINNTASVDCAQLATRNASSVNTVSGRTPGVISFMDGNWDEKYSFGVGEVLYMQVADPDRNRNPAIAETIEVVLTHPDTGDSETVILVETGDDTGIFRGFVPTDSGPAANDNAILTVGVDTRVIATYTDPLDVSPVVTAIAYIDPFGVVFNSVTGQPVAGAVVTLMDASTDTPASLPFDPNPAPATDADGSYEFPLVPAGSYYLSLSLPAGYTYPSVVTDGELPPGFTTGTGSRGETFTLVLGMEPLNLDIPVDPLPGELAVSKNVNRSSVSIGDMVRYTITVNNQGDTKVTDINVYDTMPHGIGYVKGTSSLGGTSFDDPAAQPGRTLVWTIPEIEAGATVELEYTAVIGVDSHKGDGKNYVYASGTSVTQEVVSNRTYAQVRISEGIFTGKGTIIGKVFFDRNGNKIQDDDEEGLEGVAIYMEDGTRTVTDRAGKYSIPLVNPGTRVLRVDESTLPAEVEPAPLSNRFAGEGSSQFTDVVRHGLSKANFAVREKGAPPQKTIFTVQAATYSPDKLNKARESAALLEGENIHEVRVENINGTYVIRAGVYETKKEAEKSLERIKRKFPDSFVRSAYYIEERIVGGTREKPVSASALPGIPKPFDWEEAIKELTPEFAFLNMENGATISSDQVRVLLKTGFSARVALSVNGVKISDKQLGRKIEYQAGNIAIHEFIGIRLVRGQNNLLTAGLIDPFGNMREETSVTVYVTGNPEKITVIPGNGSIHADGRSLLHVEINILDKEGSLIPYSGTVTVSVSKGEIREKDADAFTSGHQVPVADGKASFNIIAPYEPAAAEIHVYAGGVEETAKVNFTPHLRNMLLVGAGELKLGHGSKKGADLLDDRHFSEGFHAGGRGAFFLKGKVFSDLLLTASYDSDKPGSSDFFRQNERNPESGEKYPVYGDESKTGYEALSTDRVFIRIDKDMSHIMYGDYRTGLQDTTLAAYTRTFTGLNAGIDTEKFNLKAFASHTSRSQFLDTIRGRGISGYYYLAQVPVVEGSERIVIETRDRLRPDRVLKRETMVSGHDYFIDYDSGAILFKFPVPSLDINLNPVFIIASYESDSEGRKYYIYGGRAAYKLSENIEIGITSVTEKKEISDYRLFGTDATLTLPMDTTIKAEWAQTRSIFDIGGVLAPKNGKGWLLEITSSPFKNLKADAYYRKLDDYFGNLSATDAMRGTEKYGAELSYLPGDKKSSVFGKYFKERDTLNNTEYEYLSAGLERKFETARIKGEAYYEHSDSRYIAPPDPGSRFPFDISRDVPEEAAGFHLMVEKKLNPDLAITAEYKSNFLSAAGNIGQLGMEYRLEEHRKAYIRQQFARLEDRSEARTAAGIEAEIATNTVAFNEYRLADGMEGGNTQQSIGLRNKFMLGENITGSISVENLYTVSGSQRQDEPDAFAAAAGLEYLPRENVKITNRLEHRNAANESSSLAEFGLAYRFNPDYTLLFRERFFYNDLENGSRFTSRTLLGLAYRPVENDRFNALARLEMKKDKDTASAAGYNSDSYIGSVEGIYQAGRHTQLTGKYAGKLSKDYAVSSYTDLISARITRDIGDRFDMGIEYRILNSYEIGSTLQGGSAELGCRLFSNAWLSLGYSFDSFDTDLTGNYYSGKGPYVIFRIKLDERLFK